MGLARAEVALAESLVTKLHTHAGQANMLIWELSAGVPEGQNMTPAIPAVSPLQLEATVRPPAPRLGLRRRVTATARGSSNWQTPRTQPRPPAEWRKAARRTLQPTLPRWLGLPPSLWKHRRYLTSLNILESARINLTCKFDREVIGRNYGHLQGCHHA